MLERPVYICRLCGKENNSFDECDCKRKNPLIWDNNARSILAEKLRNIKSKFNTMKGGRRKND